MKPPVPPHVPAPVTHYENFPVASLLCPPQLRAPIAAIYAFARTADDLADEGELSAAQRLADVRFGDAVREFVACDAEGGDEGEVEEQFERRRAAVRVAEIAPRHALEPVTVIAGCGHLGSAPSLVDI